MRSEMGRRDLAIYTLVLYAWFVVLILAFDDYPNRMHHTGDNASYAGESAAIRGAPPPGMVAQHFLGFSMATAAVARLFRVSDWAGILIVSVLASLGAVALAGELWGGTIAAWFAVMNLDWVQRSLLGGAEPIFCLLIFGALAAVRRERWMAAALLGALATVVRPLGVFVLIAIGIELLRRRRVATATGAVAVSLAIAGAYLALVRALFGHAFANFEWYSKWGLGRDRTFIPYVTLILSYRDRLLTKRNVAKTLAWTTLTLLGVAAAIRRDAVRQEMREHRAEWLFGAIYLASFFFFPAWWIEGEYSRYLAPVIPMVLVAMRPWVPSNRVVLWIGGFLGVTLAAVKDMPAVMRLG